MRGVLETGQEKYKISFPLPGSKPERPASVESNICSMPSMVTNCGEQ